MSGISINVDTGTTFYTGGANYNAIARLGDNTFIVAYADENDSLKGKVIVGTRAGTSVTIDTLNVVTFEEGEVMEIGITALSSSLFVISYVDVSDSSTVKMIAGTVSGTTITLGAIATMSGYTGCEDTAICTLDSSHFITSVVYANNVYSIIGSVSGTTITMDNLSVTTFSTASTCDHVDVATLNSTDFVNVWNEYNDIYARVGIADIGGSGITRGAAKSVDTTDKNTPKVAIFDELHFVVLYSDTSQQGWVKAGSVDDITHAITLGDAVGFQPANASYFSICTMDSTHFISSYHYVYNDKGILQAGSLSGSTTLTFDAQAMVTFENSITTYTTICKLTSDYFIVGFKHA